MIDHYLARVFQTLQEEGLWDNTIIIFTADHGDYAGQFGLLYKGLPYEGAAHIPMIVRHPIGGRGRVEDRLVCNMDLFATFLRTAGVAVPDECDSRDLTPLLRDEGAADWDNRVRFKARGLTMLIRDHYKLMRATVRGRPVAEFYDLAEEPIESVNRIADPAHQERIAAMKGELEGWIQQPEKNV